MASNKNVEMEQAGWVEYYSLQRKRGVQMSGKG